MKSDRKNPTEFETLPDKVRLLMILTAEEQQFWDHVFLQRLASDEPLERCIDDADKAVSLRRKSRNERARADLEAEKA